MRRCSDSTASASTLKASEIEEKEIAMKDVGVQASVTEIPRRKPLPLPKDQAVTDEEYAGSHPPLAGAAPKVHRSVKGFLLFPFWISLVDKVKLDWRSGGKKKRNVIIVAVVAAVVLVGLILGLAIGLSVGGENGVDNLPLPTDTGGRYKGDLTYYTPALGACGITSSNSESVCAVSRILYDAASISANPNENPLCGLKLRLRRGGKSVDVTIVDRCEKCQPTDIDVSMSVFEKIAVVDHGRVDVEWAWIDPPPVNIRDL